MDSMITGDFSPSSFRTGLAAALSRSLSAVAEAVALDGSLPPGMMVRPAIPPPITPVRMLRRLTRMIFTSGNVIGSKSRTAKAAGHRQTSPWVCLLSPSLTKAKNPSQSTFSSGSRVAIWAERGGENTFIIAHVSGKRKLDRAHGHAGSIPNDPQSRCIFVRAPRPCPLSYVLNRGLREI